MLSKEVEFQLTARRLIKVIRWQLVFTFFMAIGGVIWGANRGNILGTMFHWITRGLIIGAIFGAAQERIVSGWIGGAVFGAISGVIGRTIRILLEWTILGPERSSYPFGLVPFLVGAASGVFYAILGVVFTGLGTSSSGSEEQVKE